MHTLEPEPAEQEQELPVESAPVEDVTNSFLDQGNPQ
jgi:hypothetical protein